MLRMLTGPVEIVRYEHMGANRPEGGFTYRDGSPVEAVVVRPEGEDRDRVFKLLQHSIAASGSRLPVGTLACMILQSDEVEAADIGRDGRPYPTRKHKFSLASWVAPDQAPPGDMAYVPQKTPVAKQAVPA